jgi:hypothetical protein
MTRALVVVGVTVALGAAAAPAPAPARADASFEAAASGAEHVQRLDDVVWALTATCTAGDDIEQRQCRRVRDARAAELAHETLLIEAEPTALEVGAWNAQRRSVSIHLTACIRCGGVAVDGATWQLVGGAPHSDGGVLTGATLYDGARTFTDEAGAKAWIASLAGARVELLVRLAPAAHAAPDRPRSPPEMPRSRPEMPRSRPEMPRSRVIAFDVLGFRVVTPCDGAVVLAKPPAAPLAPDKAACARHPVKVEK